MFSFVWAQPHLAVTDHTHSGRPADHTPDIVHEGHTFMLPTARFRSGLAWAAAPGGSWWLPAALGDPLFTLRMPVVPTCASMGWWYGVHTAANSVVSSKDIEPEQTLTCKPFINSNSGSTTTAERPPAALFRVSQFPGSFSVVWP